MAPAQTLSDQCLCGAVRFTAAPVYIDEKPANFAFANDTRKLTSAEVEAKYAPRQD